MKFQKLVKSLGADGVIYVRENKERWLTSGTAFMKIPDDICSVVASEIAPMPEYIDKVISYADFADPCELHKAIMPCADSVIKDCIRIYATENALNKLAISNTDYSLIERKDVVEMYVKYNAEEEIHEAKALIIKDTGNLIEEQSVIGIIFPTNWEQQEVTDNVH